MDVVIPLGTGSLHDNIELRYTLRAFEKYVRHDKVFIVGERPKWLKNVLHITGIDQSGAEWKELNILNKIREAVFDDRVSDNFIFANDDHFIQQPWEHEYLYNVSLRMKLATRRHGDQYRKTIANTLSLIGGGHYYDIHCPIVYNKEKFEETVVHAPWHKPWGFCIKSLYGNLNGVNGRLYPDMKIGKHLTLEQAREKVAGRLFFSTASNISPGMLALLDEIYPNKSRYET